MEREILIANTRTQQRHKITTDATTLGELKAVLDEQHIDYTGMSFTEGISNIQLNDDNSQLPHDLNYKGKVTNNLVIILTNTTKNIASGVPTRAELFAFLKENGYSKDIMLRYHHNMTQVSTPDLLEYAQSKGFKTEEEDDLDTMSDDILSQYGFQAAKVIEEEDTEEEEEETWEDIQSNPVNHAIDSIIALVQHYINVGTITEENCESVSEAISDVLSESF